MSSPEWLTWAFWTADKSEAFRNLSLSIAGVVSFFFLVWRAISADRSSKAAIKQAQAALSQIEIATKQIEIASKQSEAAIKQSEASVKQSAAATKQADIASDRQITDILSRAIDQLGSDKSAIIRAGAVYTLGRIANDSPRDHGLIMELLEHYVRTEARRLHDDNQEQQANGHEYSDVIRAQAILKTLPPWIRDDGGKPITPQQASKLLEEYKEEYKEKLPELLHALAKPILDAETSMPEWQKMIGQYYLSPDIQACLTVLGSRYRAHEPDATYIDLRDTDLRGAQLSGMNFKQTALSNTDLRGSALNHTIMEGCVAVAANFSGAFLMEARFNNSNLAFCNFSGARIEGANFDGTDLGVANLRNASGITREQLRCAHLTKHTQLPDGLTI